MELTVYRSADGGAVLVPVALLPPRDAVRVHGPLTTRGHVHIADVDAAPWPELVLQLERHLFAVLGPAEADVLFGGMGVCATDAR